MVGARAGIRNDGGGVGDPRRAGGDALVSALARGELDRAGSHRAAGVGRITRVRKRVRAVWRGDSAERPQWPAGPKGEAGAGGDRDRRCRRSPARLACLGARQRSPRAVDDRSAGGPSHTALADASPGRTAARVVQATGSGGSNPERRSSRRPTPDARRSRAPSGGRGGLDRDPRRATIMGVPGDAELCDVVSPVARAGARGQTHHRWDVDAHRSDPPDLLAARRGRARVGDATPAAADARLLARARQPHARLHPCRHGLPTRERGAGGAAARRRCKPTTWWQHPAHQRHRLLGGRRLDVAAAAAAGRAGLPPGRLDGDGRAGCA
jgi:hypothetical protein